MINRLNDLDSKTYMKFLKSWFIFSESSLLDFINFFTKEKEGENKSSVGIWGINGECSDKLKETKRKIIKLEESNPDFLNYAILDLRQSNLTTSQEIDSFFATHLNSLLKNLQKSLKKKTYLTLLVNNYQNEVKFFPAAWYIGKKVALYFEMKDEKIACMQPRESNNSIYPIKGSTISYALNFRNSLEATEDSEHSNFKPSLHFKNNSLEKWFILKPPSRKEKVKLHPAKYPEVLIDSFIRNYSKKDESVFDPMSGTGSTQVAALEAGRCAYGTEITHHFYEIALERLQQINTNSAYFMANDDAYNFNLHKDFPAYFDYIITSPPYWDMLNMKGAETQKNRIEKKLRTNYSELDTDLGNCADYDLFLTKLLKIYHKILRHLKNGGYFTVIVKNIKKKGTIYTFAWDLVERLTDTLELSNVQFWLQDDIRLAPYGYGNAWVSNTFHHYCLTFKKVSLSQ